jgi:hypothetical protein
MKNKKDGTLTASPEYRRFIEDLKTRVISARISAAGAVNRDLILLYWDIGRGIVVKQEALGWGQFVIDRISADLQETFPATTGFSPRNLRDMKRFYLAYADETIWRQAVAKLEARDAPADILRQPVAELGGDKKRLQAVAKLEGRDDSG